jgi:hypothetical protein
MDKQELIKSLEKKLKDRLSDFLDGYLQGSGEKFIEGENRYSHTQQALAALELNNEFSSPSIMALSNVLNNLGQRRPTYISNVNSNENFPVYQFLQKLLEPGETYFGKAGKYGTVLEYLVSKYDKSFPSKKNGFDFDDHGESQAVYLEIKTAAVKNLLQSFIWRGIVRGVGHTAEESVNKIMTKSRYEYLNTLAESFSENPKSRGVVAFVKELPSNAWFDHTIDLICDHEKEAELEFEELKTKYIPDYKLSKEMSSVTYANTGLGREGLPF